MLANQSTALPNSTNLQIGDSQLNYSSQLPIIQRTFALEKQVDFHKKLQGKLDKLSKKKDYQLLLELTKQKMVQTFSLPNLFGQQTKEQDIDPTKGKGEIPSLGAISRPMNLKLSSLKRSSNIDLLSPIAIHSKGQVEKQGDSQPISPNIGDNESDSSDNQELQALIAEGEGKKQKKAYQISYSTGTKSILCKRFIKLGQCPNGKKCEYAHSKKELQFNSPQEWVELIKNISNQQYKNEDNNTLKFVGDRAGINGLKSLMEACKIDDYRGVEQLLLNGANPVAQDFNGFDGLYYAVVNNSIRSIKKIFELGSSKIISNRVYGKKKRNLLTIAAIYSFDDRILDCLLNNGRVKFNPNQTDRFQRNAIFYSLFRNKVAAVKLFVSAQSSLDIPDLRDLYLIDYALQFNFEEILLELVKGGARLGIKLKKGVQIMMHAASVGSFDLIKALISKNVALTSLSQDCGYNCLMIALQSGKKDLILQLSKYIINVDAFNQQDRDYGESLMMKAIQRGDLDIVEVLCAKQGIILGQKDKQGKTELIHAVEKDSYQGVKAILLAATQMSLDLEMNHYDRRQRTALIYASINQNHHIMELLLNQQFLDSREQHVVKWKDEIGKDVCDYAQTDSVKLALSKYIEKNNMLYQNYYQMMHTLSQATLNNLNGDNNRHSLQDLSSDTQRGGDGNKHNRQQLDVSQLKLVAAKEKMRQKSTKNKLKKIEDEISREADLMRQSMEGAENEKIQILQQISKQRLKQLRTIAIKFPKLTNIEQNPKFRQAIKHLYADSDLSKFKKDLGGRQVNDILENHSPQRVLKKHKLSKYHSLKELKLKLSLDTNSDLQLPSLRGEMIHVSDEQGSTYKGNINIKDTLTKIFSAEQLHQFKALAETLNKDLELESARLSNNQDKDKPPVERESVMKQQVLSPLKLIDKRSKTTKKKRLIGFKQEDNSDIENEIEDDMDELMQLAQAKNLSRKIQSKITQNFS